MRRKKDWKKAPLKIDITGLTIDDRAELQKRIDTQLGVAEVLVRNDYIHNIPKDSDDWQTTEFHLLFTDHDSQTSFEQYFAASCDDRDTVFLMGGDSGFGHDYSEEDSYDVDSFNDMLFELLAEKIE